MNIARHPIRKGRAYDFASILFAGPCNQRCPYCIGQQLPAHLVRSNLLDYPPRNLDRFVALVKQCGIDQITLSGTNTDPQLYRHEEKVIDWLRTRLPGIQLSLHTNGQLALSRMEVFNTYDRATISFPAFDPYTFAQMTGVTHMPDLAAILGASRIPIKISCVLTPWNIEQVDEFVVRCRDVGIRRVALRELYGDRHKWRVIAQREPDRLYWNNPVYTIDGVEVTVWRFERTTAASLNLFSDGTIGTEYLLPRTT